MLQVCDFSEMLLASTFPLRRLSAGAHTALGASFRPELQERASRANHETASKDHSRAPTSSKHGARRRGQKIHSESARDLQGFVTKDGFGRRAERLKTGRAATTPQKFSGLGRGLCSGEAFERSSAPKAIAFAARVL